MKLTSADVAGFVGGQAEVQNGMEGYLYRGLIQSIAVEGEELKIKFAWLAKGEGFPPLPSKWIMDGRLDYAASLEIYSVSNIGPGSEGGKRICLNSMIAGETVVLNPPDGSKLDPRKVEGLPKASERLLALFPALNFDREVARKILVDKCWPHQVIAFDVMSTEATLNDVLSTFIHDSTVEEFLWHYIEATTGEKDVHHKVY